MYTGLSCCCLAWGVPTKSSFSATLFFVGADICVPWFFLLLGTSQHTTESTVWNGQHLVNLAV